MQVDVEKDQDKVYVDTEHLYIVLIGGCRVFNSFH